MSPRKPRVLQSELTIAQTLEATLQKAQEVVGHPDVDDPSMSCSKYAGFASLMNR